MKKIQNHALGILDRSQPDDTYKKINLIEVQVIKYENAFFQTEYVNVNNHVSIVITYKL